MSNPEKTVMFALPNMMSGQLACVAGTAAGRSWDLSAGTFTIGRLDEHDMSLPQEPGISKLHAKIIGQGDRYLITDCESRNGTLVNGELIQRADLYDGDEIRICGCVLRFTQKGGPARPRPRPESMVPSMVPSPSTVPTNPSQAPQYAAPPPTYVPVAAPEAPGAGHGRSLALWYAAGLFGSLLIGGGASAALVASAPAPVVAPPVVATVAPTPPVATPPPVPAVVDAGVAEAVVVDAGVAEVAPVAVAENTVDKPDEDELELALEPTSTTKKPTTSSSSNAAPAAAKGGTFAATVDGGKSESVKSKTGGRVRSVEVKDGAQVQKGTILVTFEAGADADEIATLQDRIASLEAVDSDEARRDLKTAKARLSALEGSAKATPITAGMDGKLTGFNVAAGSVLKAGEVVGKIGDGEVSTRVRVTIARGVAARGGDKVRLVLKAGGTAEGTIVAVSGRNVVVDTGSEAADGVESVAF